MSVIWIAQKKNIQFNDRAAPERTNGRIGFMLRSSLLPSFFKEYSNIKGKAKNTLKNTKTGDGNSHQMEKSGIEPHISVAKNISSRPLLFGFIGQLPL